MKCRSKFLIKTYLWTMLVFIIAKIVFMLACREGHAFTVGDIYDVVAHGLTLDLSTALYFFIIPFLISMTSVWIRIPKWLTYGYFILISLAFSLAFVADTSLYPFWGFKLDASCLQYLETPTEAVASVSTGYLVVRLIAFCFIVAMISGGYYWLTKKQINLICPARQANILSRLTKTALHLIMIPAIIIGIRGGIGESTTNIGQVYYSQDQFLNHSAVNPVFSFLYSLGHQIGDTSEYEFFSDDECREIVERVYTTESINTDTLLNTRQPDILIILLESAGEQFASVMPYLQQLKQEGISFSRCYANSWRTDRGTVSALSGYPTFPSLSVMKMPEKSRTLPSIAGSLQHKGYQTTYLYGGDINFTNMRSYLVSTGWEQLVSMDDFSIREQHTGQWGVRDDITFKRLSQLIQSHHQSQHHYLIGYSTLSSHEPWDVPTKTNADEALNAFAYLDQCLKDFIEPLRQTPAWQNLLIVMLADHGINYRDIDMQKPLQKNHIPMVWVGGAVKAPRQIDKLCNQSDLAATLLNQLGLPHSEFSFSRDVLSSSYSYPTAVNNYYNAQWIADSTGNILYDFDAHHFVVNECSDADRLLRVSKAILQTTTNDLKQR